MLADRLTVLAVALVALVFWHAGRRYERALRLDRQLDAVRRVARPRWCEEVPPAARVLPPYDWDGDAA